VIWVVLAVTTLILLALMRNLMAMVAEQAYQIAELCQKQAELECELSARESKYKGRKC
jgi:hypothetical protein